MPQYNTYNPAAPLGGNEIILVEQGGVTLRTTPNSIRSLIGYVLPIANVSTVGGVKSGTDITIDTAGLMSVNDNSHNHTWGNITSTPTTLAGYGITDAVGGAHSHAWTDITSTPTALAGYGILDAAPLSHVGGNIHLDWTVAAGTIHASNYTDTNTTDHTAFSNIGTNTHAQIDTHIGLVNEHLDWTLAVGTIHASNYTDTNITDHTAFSNIGTNTHAQIDTHIADATVHFTKGSIALTDLSDTVGTFTSLLDGQVLTYDTTNGWQNETIPAGITDHTLLSNIGTNTHAQIDTHIALVNEHLDWTIAAGTIHASNYTDTVYVLPVADTGILGGVRDGTDLSIDVLGNVSVNDNSHSHTWSNISDQPGLTGLADVINSFTTLTDGQVLTYDTINGWQNETPAAGVTDHTLLSNIGTKTHPEIDTHIGLGNEHLDWTAAVGTIHASNYTDTVYTHPTTAGNVHLPAGGTTGQVVEWLSAGTGQWVTPGSTAESNDLTLAVTWANIPIANVPTGTTGTTVALGDHTHDAAYISLVGTPTTGNFPQLTAGGELVNSIYDETSFATFAQGALADSAVQSVTGGVGIDSTGGTTPNLTLDLSELSIQTIVAANFLTFTDGTISRRSTVSSTRLSYFDNDSGWTSNVGDVVAGGAYHDGFSDFVANEHIDWTVDQGATNIHTGNYTNTVYSHPGYTARNASFDTTLLAGATVISDINFDLVTDTSGHVTTGAVSFATRELTAANVGAATSAHTHSAYNQNINLSGASVYNNIAVTNGIVTNVSNRTLTPAHIGAATSAHTHTKANITDFAETDYLSATSIDTAGATIIFNGGLTLGTSQVVQHNSTSSKDKLRVWNSSSYSMGMKSGFTYGYIGSDTLNSGTTEYCMTFQMSATAARGFHWGDINDTASTGAMSLTTTGKLYVNDIVNGNRFISRIATGTAPFTVASTTKVTNLNADLLDGANLSSVAGNSTVVQRTGSGYIYANYFNGSSSFSTTGANSGMDNFIGTNGSDTFARSYSRVGARLALGLIVEKHITVEEPVVNDEVLWFFTNRAITATELRTVAKSTSNINVAIYRGTSIGTIAGTVNSAAITSTTSGHDANISQAIPANSFVWIKVTSVTTAPTSFHMSLIGNIT